MPRETSKWLNGRSDPLSGTHGHRCSASRRDEPAFIVSRCSLRIVPTSDKPPPCPTFVEVSPSRAHPTGPRCHPSTETVAATDMTDAPPRAARCPVVSGKVVNSQSLAPQLTLIPPGRTIGNPERRIPSIKCRCTSPIRGRSLTFSPGVLADCRLQSVETNRRNGVLCRKDI